MDVDFAKKHGFAERVVHVALLNSFISQNFGVHLPEENCLLHSMNTTFLSPVITCDEIEIIAPITQASKAAGVVIASTSAFNTRPPGKYTARKNSVWLYARGVQ